MLHEIKRENKIVSHNCISENLSSKAIEYQRVCVFVCSFPNSSKTVDPNELKFWGMISLGVQKVLG